MQKYLQYIAAYAQLVQYTSGHHSLSLYEKQQHHCAQQLLLFSMTETFILRHSISTQNKNSTQAVACKTKAVTFIDAF